MRIEVENIGKDGWSRPLLKAMGSGLVFCDISCGDSVAGNITEAGQPVERNGIVGDWHTTTPEWEEPISPLGKHVTLVLKEGE